MSHGLQVGPFFVLGFLVFHSKFPFFGFRSNAIHIVNWDRKIDFRMIKTIHRVSESENAENNRRLLMKMEGFCSEVLFRVLWGFCFWVLLILVRVCRFYYPLPPFSELFKGFIRLLRSRTLNQTSWIILDFAMILRRILRFSVSCRFLGFGIFNTNVYESSEWVSAHKNLWSNVSWRSPFLR